MRMLSNIHQNLLHQVNIVLGKIHQSLIHKGKRVLGKINQSLRHQVKIVLRKIHQSLLQKKVVLWARPTELVKQIVTHTKQTQMQKKLHVIKKGVVKKNTL